MRKMWMSGLVAVLAALVCAAVAFGAGQVNTYTVTGAIKGGKGATSKKPKPVAVNFDYTVGEVSNLRPSPITKYSIQFQGLRTNGSAFPQCDAAKLNSVQNLSACPKGSLMGSGKVENQVGVNEDPTDKSLKCHLELTTVNGTGKNEFLLWLESVPNATSLPNTDPKFCVIAVHQAIVAKFVKKPGGTALEFTVPQNLLHPGGPLDNAVVNVTSSIKKATVKKKGKTIGFFESTSCAKTAKITVFFTQESDGSVKQASKVAPCTK